MKGKKLHGIAGTLAASAGIGAGLYCCVDMLDWCCWVGRAFIHRIKSYDDLFRCARCCCYKTSKDAE